MNAAIGSSDAFIRACGMNEMVMARGLKFHKLFAHAWYKKQLLKINQKETEFIFDFIAENGHLDRSDYYLRARDVFNREKNCDRVRKSARSLVAEILDVLKEV